MAHLWLRKKAPEWTPHPVAVSEFDLKSFLAEALENDPAVNRAPSDVRLFKTKADDQENWVILAGHESGIAINGLPLLFGIRVLRDRDEIRWGPEGFAFLSLEEPASVVDLPQGGSKIFCPRCKQEIMPGTPAVQCPGCRVWHHQSETLPCYTYAENCATCMRKTQMDGEYDWSPPEEM